jgi:Na+(H+)/acetate symporter ActP
MAVKKRLTACAMAMTLALFVLSSSTSLARDFYDDRFGEEPSSGEMFVDAIAVRPLTLVASAVGLVGWVVTLPVTLFSGNAGDAGQAWVLDPLAYTFVRPLGQMDEDF